MSLEQSKQGIGTVETFIRQELFGGGQAHFDETTDLIEAGVIDSLSLMRLISHLEEHCQVQVADEEMVAENFRSLAAIQSFLAKHQSVTNLQDD